MPSCLAVMIFSAALVWAGEAVDSSSSDKTVSDDQVLAVWKGGSLSTDTLSARTEAEVRAMHTRYLLDRYELEYGTLQVMIDERLLEQGAGERGYPSIDAWLVAEIESKAPDPSEEALTELYEGARSQIPGIPYEEVRPMLVGQLRQQWMAERYEQLITDLRVAHAVKIRLPYPEIPRVQVPIGEHDPVRGSEDAEITIVQYAEYQCYYCARAASALDEVLRVYAGKVRLVYKDFPLDMHADAVPAAVAAHCAGEQGQYWEMNELLLANQQRLSAEDLRGYGSALGLKKKKFEACLTSGGFEAVVNADLEEGKRLGVQATPTFFVNGILVSGAQPFERFADVIDRELAVP